MTYSYKRSHIIFLCYQQIASLYNSNEITQEEIREEISKLLSSDHYILSVEGRDMKDSKMSKVKSKG